MAERHVSRLGYTELIFTSTIASIADAFIFYDSSLPLSSIELAKADLVVSKAAGLKAGGE